jgi:hypothetical protein
MLCVLCITKLYNAHLKCAHHNNGMWQYVQNIIESKLNDTMNTFYKKLKQNLDLLTQQTRHTNVHKINTHTENNRLINLTNITFTREQINTLKLGPQESEILY